MQVTVLVHFMLALVMLFTWGVSEAKQDELRCFHAQSIGRGTLVSFLLGKNGTRSKSFVLYSSIWNEDRQLVYCNTNEDDVIVGHYLSLCDRTHYPHVVDISSIRYNLSVVLVPHSPCYGHDISFPEVNDSQGGQFIKMGRQTSETSRRTKRAVIFPGTLWCGTGSKALDYQQLGMFELTDRCCREHDHCSSVIHAFTVNFGVFNRNFFSVSHCDCDHRFRKCLMDVDDAISHMVGYSFFNILQVPCFEFTQKRHCSKLNWWGRCTEIEVAPYAVLQTQGLYNATHLTSRPKGTAATSASHPVTVQKPSSPFGKKAVPPRDCGRGESVSGDTLRPKSKKGRKSQCQKAKKVIPSQSNTKSVTPPLRKISFRTKVTTFPTVGDVANTQKNISFFFKPQTTSQPSAIPGKNITWPQMTPPEKLINLSSAQTPTVSTTHSFLNQTTPPSLQSSNRPTQKQQRCGQRSLPRGDSFFPSHPGGEACLEAELPPAEDTVKESEHHRDLIQIPVPQTSMSDKATTSLNEVVAQAKNTASVLTSNDSSVRTTKSPQGRPTSSMQKSTPSTVVASREISTATRSPAITSPNQTTATIPTPSETTASSKQKTQPITQKPDDSSRQIAVRILPPKKSNSASAAAKKLNPSGTHLCSHLKDLDDCTHKIPPFERRYGYYNNESKNMYHCDCTHRLSGHLRHLKDAKTIQSILQAHVSLLCFGLQSTKYCSESTRCLAVVFPATGLLVALRKMDYGGAVIKQQRRKRFKRRTPIRLFKHCLKMMQSKLT